MELREIMLVVQGHTNAARTALNSGDEEKCKARLADLSAFLISDGPTPVDETSKETEADSGKV